MELQQPDLKRVQRNIPFLAKADISHLIFPKTPTEGKEGNGSYLMQRLEIAFQAHVQRLRVLLVRDRELRLLSLRKPPLALQSDPPPAPHNFSNWPPPPPPLQDTPPVISCVNHTGCPKTWNRISPAVVSSFAACAPARKRCPAEPWRQQPVTGRLWKRCERSASWKEPFGRGPRPARVTLLKGDGLHL